MTERPSTDALLSKPTSLMLAALARAYREDGLRRTPPAEWPAAPATLHALVRRGWLDHSTLRNRHGVLYDVWRVSVAGEVVLNPPPRVIQERDWYMRKNGGYTRDKRESIDPELAVVFLDERWVLSAEARHDAAQRPRDLARDLAMMLKAAA
jgi:hypothetical protein